MRRALLTLGLVLCSLPGAAQQALTKYTVDNGGGRSSGGAYVLTGTAGQIDAVPMLVGGSYRLGGGFWTALPPDDIFSDGFEGD